jgi:hypothetical protein
MGKILAICSGIAVAVIVAIMTAWAMLAIYYSDILNETLRACCAGLFGIVTICGFISLPNRRRTLLCFLALFAIILVWWFSIKPSHNRDWQAEVAVLPYAAMQGSLVTIHNIRNFNYRTETDFDARYYDKTFDINKLTSVDLISVYWMGDAIAHVMISFGFGESDYVTFSIETRKAKGQEYSSIKGFFKQYGLICIAGDERDLIRVRTSFRNPREDVYLYRIRVSPERARQFFMEYVKMIDDLRETPEFYNTLTTNCTTGIITLIRAFGGDVSYSWKILLSGYAAEYAYELGRLNTSMPFAELRKRSYINKRAHEAGNDQSFSLKIRAGLPLPDLH